MTQELHVVNQVDALRMRIGQWRADNETIGFVPTMGNLHDGHLDLVRRAKSQADRCVVSIFVNPMQFGPQEDFDRYPKTPEEDRRKLAEVGTDLLFMPSTKAIYPRDFARQTRVEVPELSDILCGASRPGHFVGVATVVCKLFNLVQPDLAVFGEKDFQQLLVIRRMVQDLAMPVRIVGAPTVRESDGLAKSSRNGYLSAEERKVAPALQKRLQLIAQAIMDGETDYDRLMVEGLEALWQSGFKPDYLSVRRAEDLQLPAAADRELVIVSAAYLGETRLIDNLRVSRASIH